MSLIYFVLEFFAAWENLIPSAIIVPVACLLLVLFARRRKIGSPAMQSFLASVIAGWLIFAAFLLSVLGLSRDLVVLAGDPFFWTGLGLSTLLAWPVVWMVAMILHRRQRRAELRDTSAFE